MKTLIDILNESIKTEVLTDGLKNEINTIFEASVSQKVAEKMTTLVAEKEKEFTKKSKDLTEEVNKDLKTFKSELTVRLEDYLNHVVAEFVKENKPVLDSQCRVVIAEKFFGNIKKIFTDASVDVEQESLNVMDQMRSEFTSLQSNYKTLVEQNISISKELMEYKKANIMSKAMEDMTMTEKKQVVDMMEGIQVSSLVDFQSKLNLVIEKFMKKTTTTTRKPVREELEIKPNETTDNSGVNRLLPRNFGRRK